MRNERFSGDDVWSCWQKHGDEQPMREAIVHYERGVATRRWKWGELLACAESYASSLTAMGVRRGDVCGIIIKHDAQFYPLYLGIIRVAAIPAVLAYPNPRLHPDKFRKGLIGMSLTSGLDWVLTDRTLQPLVEPLVSSVGTTIRGVLFPLEADNAIHEQGGQRWTHKVCVSPPDPCLLQHSSGTTGLQKAVVLSHRSVLEHVRRYGDVLGLSTADRVVSWLPLYHDMGLIAAFHLPMASGVTTVMIDPFEWVAAPVLFLQACSIERGTIGWLPNFAYNLMAARVNEEDLDGVRLDTLRLLINCSEPVRADSHERFAHRFKEYGFKRSALAASYAMAETTFAVTQTDVGTEARQLRLSRDALAAGHVVSAGDGDAVREVVSSGRPIDGCDVRVVDPETLEEQPNGRVGELRIRSVSLFDGYRNNPEETAKVLQDGWYNSGDLGFVDDGEFFVIGRKKDLIIVAGKNIYPEDVEDAVGEVEGIIAGRVVAFGIDDADTGTERICVVAETRYRDRAEVERLKRDVVVAGMKIDVTIADVYLVELRWLIKSSAGKPSRSANKARILEQATTTSDGS